MELEWRILSLKKDFGIKVYFITPSNQSIIMLECLGVYKIVLDCVCPIG